MKLILNYKSISSCIDNQVLFDRLFSTLSNTFWLDSSSLAQGARFSYMGVLNDYVGHTLTFEINKNLVLKDGVPISNRSDGNPP